MQIVSINSGLVQDKPWRNGTQTAIQKTTVGEEPVFINEQGLSNDEQADDKNHGGADKALLVLPSSAYQRFDIAQPYGFLGENITLDGADETTICLGDRLQIGTLLLEVSQPRSPCWKLDQLVGEIMDIPQGAFLKCYSESGHVGFYCRVLAVGHAKKGQEVVWLTRDKANKNWAHISIKELFLAKLNAADAKSKRILQEALKHPALSKAWKLELQKLV